MFIQLWLESVHGDLTLMTGKGLHFSITAYKTKLLSKNEQSKYIKQKTNLEALNSAHVNFISGKITVVSGMYLAELDIVVIVSSARTLSWSGGGRG